MKLRANPFIEFTDEQGSRTAINRLSGATHRLDRNACCALDEIIRRDVVFDQLPENLKASAGELLKRDFVVFESSDGKSHCFRNPVRQPLFNSSIGSLAIEDRPGVALIGVPYGQGNTVDNGCQSAPLALRKRSRSLSLDWANLTRPGNIGLAGLHFSEFPELVESASSSRVGLSDYGDILCYHSEPRGAIFSRIEATVRAFASNRTIPFLIGGDHSITLPAVRAVSALVEPLHLIHIDAHTDTYSSLFDRKLAATAVNHGNFVQHLVSENLVASTIQIGARGLPNINSKKTAADYQVFVKDGDLSSLAQAIPDGANIYLTVDVDVLDPALMCATGHPVPSGMSLSRLFQIIEFVSRTCKLAGLDMVEFNPEYSRRNIDTDICLELCLFMCMNALNAAGRD